MDSLPNTTAQSFTMQRTPSVVRFKFFTSVIIKGTVFSDVTLCSMEEVRRRLGGKNKQEEGGTASHYFLTWFTSST
jgi:hypothetical protein